VARVRRRFRTARGSDERLEDAAQAFEKPRFYRLYRRWLRDGDHALFDVTSAVISDALAAGTGRVECSVLPHRYDHLSALVDVLGRPAHKPCTPSHEVIVASDVVDHSSRDRLVMCSQEADGRPKWQAAMPSRIERPGELAT
jgi:hypothetical protein